ncbi:unnamed protein product [Rhodiola kirilowii]
MDVDVAKDMTSVDVDLLQLPEVPPFAVESTPSLVDDLFSQWLSLPETNRLVKTLLSDGKAGATPNSGATMSSTASPTNSLPSMFKSGNAPPLSSKKYVWISALYETEGWTLFSRLTIKNNQ